MGWHCISSDIQSYLIRFYYVLLIHCISKLFIYPLVNKYLSCFFLFVPLVLEVSLCSPGWPQIRDPPTSASGGIHHHVWQVVSSLIVFVVHGLFLIFSWLLQIMNTYVLDSSCTCVRISPKYESTKGIFWLYSGHIFKLQENSKLFSKYIVKYK
jgi:hypothetical protein